jgi:hypothetical protein
MQLDFIEHIKFDIYNYYITNVCFPMLKELKTFFKINKS